MNNPGELHFHSKIHRTFFFKIKLNKFKLKLIDEDMKKVHFPPVNIYLHKEMVTSYSNVIEIMSRIGIVHEITNLILIQRIESIG